MSSAFLPSGDEPASSCQYCGSSAAERSERLNAMVCRRCYHASFTPEEIAESDRVQRQGRVAKSIRRAAHRVGNSRRQGLLDRTLLIETATSVGEVETLLDEVEQLGVRVRRRRS